MDADWKRFGVVFVSLPAILIADLIVKKRVAGRKMNANYANATEQPYERHVITVAAMGVLGALYLFACWLLS